MDNNLQSKAGSIIPIDRKSVHQICSGQVVLTLAMAVKELIENSIDAGATNIEVKLKEYGSELIEVSDNGSGVKECDYQGLTLKHHTSKLEDFSDLLNVSTFGFRGEALSSLCALGSLSIVTCHIESEVGTRLEFDHDGRIVKQTPVARPVGTTVIIENLFSTLPVRHKEFTRNIRREFGKMVNLLTAYCLISTGKRITCVNILQKGRKTVVLSTNAEQSVKGHIMSVFGNKQADSLMDFIQKKPSEMILEEFSIPTVPDDIYRIDGYISTCTHGSGRSTADRQFFFINGRPCDLPKVAKVVNDVYHSFNKHQYPFICLNIVVDRGSADINVTPDKRQIFVSQEKLLLAIVKTSVLAMYEQQPLTIKDFSSPLMKGSPMSTTSPINSASPVEKGPVALSSLKRSVSDLDDKVLKCARLDDSSCGVSTVLPEANETWDSKDPNLMQTEASVNHLECKASIDDKQSGEGSSRQLESFDFSNPSNLSQSHEPTIGSYLSNTTNHLMDVNCASTVPFKETKIESKVKMKDYDDTKSTLLKTFSKYVMGSSKSYGSSSSKNSPTKSDTTKRVLRKKSKGSKDSFQSSDCDIDSVIEQHMMDLSKLSENITRDSQSSVSDSLRFLAYKQSATSADEFESVPCEDPTPSKNPSCDLDEYCVDEIRPRRRRIVSCEFSIDAIRKKLNAMEQSKRHGQQPKYRKFRSRIDADDAEAELAKEISKDMFGKMKIIGQFNLGFIITKLEDDLFIIDQHATDEKYNFEMLQRETVLETQLLLNPQVLELTAVAEATLLENMSIFEKNGFKFSVSEEGMPGQRVKLVSVPVSQNWSFGKEDVDELIFMLADNSGRMCRPSKVSKMFASRACRKSVMIGTALNHRIMKKLVCHMGEIEHPWNCPHGRPTMRHLFSMNLLCQE